MAALGSSLSSLHLSAVSHQCPSLLCLKAKCDLNPKQINRRRRRGVRVMCASRGEGGGEEPSVPSWARPGSDEPPPWAEQESSSSSSSKGFEVPFYVYLVASAITAIAAIGSIFEYVNDRPVFGVLSSDSIFYGPVLGFFAFTGIPSSGFLWYKSVEAANKEAEEQDRRDGYR